jgi:hypothetical protein
VLIFLGHTPTWIYIGLNKTGQTGQFKWMNGANLTYATGWHPSQPGQPWEECVILEYIFFKIFWRRQKILTQSMSQGNSMVRLKLCNVLQISVRETSLKYYVCRSTFNNINLINSATENRFILIYVHRTTYVRRLTPVLNRSVQKKRKSDSIKIQHSDTVVHQFMSDCYFCPNSTEKGKKSDSISQSRTSI